MTYDKSDKMLQPVSAGIDCFDTALFYRQLTALIDMYSSTEISEHLLPITLSLAEDKVAEVRHMAFRVVSRRSLLIGSLTWGGREE